MKFILLSLLLVGCSTTRLEEPIRTEAQFSCLSTNFTAIITGKAYSATQCECAELKAVKETGLSKVEQFLNADGSPNEEVVTRFNKVFNTAIEECSK